MVLKLDASVVHHGNSQGQPTGLDESQSFAIGLHGRRVSHQNSWRLKFLNINCDSHWTSMLYLAPSIKRHKYHCTTGSDWRISRLPQKKGVTCSSQGNITLPDIPTRSANIISALSVINSDIRQAIIVIKQISSSTAAQARISIAYAGGNYIFCSSILWFWKNTLLILCISPQVTILQIFGLSC